MDVPIRLRLLGRFAIDVPSEPPRIVDISGRLRRALLAYLAMQPSLTETRERLAALLWGDSPDRQARQSLRQCLLDLRKEFERVGSDPLKIERDTVALDPNLIAVDAREFLALGQSAELADLERASDLYGGAFLDGVDLDVEPFQDWVRNERVRIESAAALVLEKCALRQDEARNGPPAIRAAERLVALDPMRESAQRLLIRLLARYGSRDAALAQADGLIATLRAELDAEPEPETAALIEEIRRSAVAPAPPVVVRRAAADVADANGRTPVGSPAATSTPDDVPAAGDDAASSLPPLQRKSAWPLAAFARFPALAYSVVGACILGVIIFTSFVRNPPSRLATVADAADQSWKPPSLLPGVAAQSPALAAQGLHALVVLPFTADGPERSPEQMMADNITGDLINDLSRVPGLRVISRQTSRLYRGRAVDVAAVGVELGVRYVVEGDVRLQGTQLRVNIALTDTKTRLQVWSERFERDDVERPGMQNEITRALARQLHVNALTVEDERRLPDRTRDPTVEDLLAKGWGAIIRGGRAGMTTSGADTYFEEVLKRDPNNVSALTGLGAHHASAAADFLVAKPEPHLKRAEEVLNKAIALKPNAGLAHYFLGVAHKARGRPHAALASFAKTLELNPSFAPAYANSAHVLYRTGRLSQATEYVRYAIRLSPKDPNLGRWSLYAGQIELELGHDDAAMEWLRRSIELGAGGVFNHATLAATYAVRGDEANAAKHADEVRKAAPWLSLEQMIERVVGLSDSGSEPRRLIEGLRKAFGNAS